MPVADVSTVCKSRSSIAGGNGTEIAHMEINHYLGLNVSVE